MEKRKEKKVAAIFAITVCLFVLFTGLFYYYREELDLRQRVTDIKNNLFSAGSVGLKFHIITDINGQTSRMSFYVPCDNLREKQHLENNISAIKHEMLLSMSVPENVRSVKSRDFNSIKANCLNIVNKYSPKPVKKVYLDFFILN